jgi:3-hydroxybutyryl-CoA dehydrogenase
LAPITTAGMNEAAIVASSIAAPRDVDTVMRLGFGFPDGPLVLADRIGLDVMQRLLRAFHEETKGDERYKANPLLDRHVRDGLLGEKTARGFLHHSL